MQLKKPAVGHWLPGVLLWWLASGVAGAVSGRAVPARLHASLRDSAGQPLVGAEIELRGDQPGRIFRTTTDARGAFEISDLSPGAYSLSVRWQKKTASLAVRLVFHEGERLEGWLELSAPGALLFFHPRPEEAGVQAAGGKQLSSEEVSSLPLNKRDFSQLLLLAAGTMTDTNGAANFTQQFAINGQRGTGAVFAMDGIYVTDPELGGATFANFNLDAIQEIRSDSGVMPAEVGAGAAGFTNVITKSGGSAVHGSVFEFVRNTVFDARNFFDRRTVASPGRLPPFIRNEFGFTNGGPVVLPGAYNGRGRTYYFAQYQGFRQVLGTTQVFPVPTPEEHRGLDTTAFPGDTLYVPVSSVIAPVLARYPLPNDPQGAYGARTFATSSKVVNHSDQFSLRIDHRLSDKGQLFARFNFNNVTGPLINPSQAAIDLSFATLFFDHQRNLGLTYTRASSPHSTSETSLGLLRTTPIFHSPNHAQPGLMFGDGLFEPFNSAAGGIFGAYGNIIQVRQNLDCARGAHSFKMGFEGRFNRDTTITGLFPNGSYTFGGGTAYAPVAIASASGQHDIRAGDPLPDALSGFLTAAPYSFFASLAPPMFPQGDHIGESAIRREAYNFYFQDAWKVTPRLDVNYGLRYEVNTHLREAKHRTSEPVLVGSDGQPVPFWASGVEQKFLFYPQPPYQMDWNGWGPRLSLEWRATDLTTLRAGGAITTVLPNLLQTNGIAGGVPFVFNPYFTAAPGAPVPFDGGAPTFNLPPVFTPQGRPVFATGRTTDVLANTEIDLLRFEQDLAAVTPGNQIQPLLVFGMSRDFRNGYMGSWTAGLEHSFGDVRVSASYVGTAGVKIVSILFPNSYGGADPAFAPFTRFDASGNAQGGYGPEIFMSNRSHSTYHSLQAAVSKTSPRAGLGFQASYTLSKSLDDSSSILGGFGTGSAGTILQAFPQDPRSPGAEKAASVFDIRQVLVFSLIQVLPFDHMSFLRPLGQRLTRGWQFLNISALTSGPPFSVFSGVQQTGAGMLGADRPDLIGKPVLSTSRNVREDYFGQGANNTAFFFIPINVPGGTGPNQGRFGTLGRNNFRGPGFHNFDIALIKDTPFGRRGASEAMTLEFRAEVFNAFNLVNFGLPANIVRGTGFGLISRTAGPSRQIQFSLRLIY